MESRVKLNKLLIFHIIYINNYNITNITEKTIIPFSYYFVKHTNYVTNLMIKAKHKMQSYQNTCHL